MIRTVLSLTLAIAGCAGSDAPSSPLGETGDTLTWQDAALDADGPFRVGHRYWRFTYQPTPDEAPREIGVSVWYPTLDEAGEDVFYENPVPLVPDPTALGEASLAPSWHEGGYPLVAYTHGNRGYTGTSADLMHHFASHGWVAVAPNHTDDLLFAEVSPPPQGHWYHRALDVQQAVDQALAAEFLGGQVAGDAYVLTGHSRGANTVWAASGATFNGKSTASWCPDCSATQLALFDDAVHDKRIVGAVPMAGTPREEHFTAAGLNDVDVPVLFLSGTYDPRGQQEHFDGTDPLPMTWVDIEGACHFTFSTGGCLETEETPTPIPDPEGFRIVNTYTLAFARALVLGDTSTSVVDTLSGARDVDARALFQRRGE